MRVVFMGTPSFVAPVLDALNACQDVSIVGVYTPPDRPRGRGRSTDMPPVKAYALENGLEVYQPASLRSSRAQSELISLHPEVIVVAAYGKLLPPPVLDTPPHGCLNLHPSLLPKYRGPSPVASAILDGVPVTGVTLMLLDEGMDTGAIIAQSECRLSGRETSETLTSALFQQGAQLLMENLGPWMAGGLTARPQEHAAASITRKLERTDGLADWHLPAAKLERYLRAYTPWPGLFTLWEGKVIKLLDVVSLPAHADHGTEPGTVVAAPVEGIPVAVAAGSGMLGLKSLQLEGRRPVTPEEFLRGYPGFLGSNLG